MDQGMTLSKKESPVRDSQMRVMRNYTIILFPVVSPEATALLLVFLQSAEAFPKPVGIASIVVIVLVDIVSSGA